MAESRQLCMIRACDLKERRFLEHPFSAIPSQEHDLQSRSAAHEQREFQRDFSDGRGRSQRQRPLRVANEVDDDFSNDHTYRYKPLPSSNHIRLLEIQLETSYGKVLSCRMTVESLTCLPRYHALSYTWGAAKETEYLYCEGKLIRVRRNLMHALKRLRNNNDMELVWADAICINQQDKDEKDKQILLMPYIYRMAQGVVVWIGDDHHREAQAAFNAVKRLSGRKDSVSHALSHSPTRHLLASFYSQGWFSRVWIIQEVAAATGTIEVLWGAHKVAWEQVCRVAAMIRTFDYMIWYAPIPTADNAYMLSRLSAGSSHSLLYWLQASRRFGCTNPKDRVYSLLGLTREFGVNGVPCAVRPNHKIRLKSLYKEVARMFMKRMGSPDVLMAVQHDIMKSYRPTWVPRWNLSHSVSIAQFDPELPGFNACKGLPRPQIEWSGNHHQVLHMQGVEVDRVVRISDTISGTDSISEQTVKLVKIIADVLAARHIYSTTDDIDHVCCWTVTAGKDHYGTLVTDRKMHLADFLEFWSCREQVIACAQGKGRIRNDWQVDRFVHAALSSCRGRRIFHTAKGYVGLGSAALRPDDIICVLCGGTVPMTLRRTAYRNRLNNQFLLIGEAYVHGIMHGGAVNNVIGKQSALISYDIV